MLYSTLRDAMKQQSFNASFEAYWTPRFFRRGASNSANVMRYDPKLATFHGAYLNERVEFDLQNTVLGEQAEDRLYKLFAHVSLTRDPRAVRDMVPKEVWASLPPDPEIKALEQRRVKLKGAVIDLNVALCSKRETGKGRPSEPRFDESIIKEESPTPEIEPPDPFPLLLDAAQFPNRFDDKRLTENARKFRYCRPNVRNNHFDDHHLEERERAAQREDPVRYLHPKCRDQKLEHLDHSRTHVELIHGVPLRCSEKVRQRRLKKAKRRRPPLCDDADP
ncbi:hypothetical protein DL764_010525 [Monosporascus ibericus]|uniref:Uncharacterized protein n=1 Tax=Monosporascus ibericus TaxID=155417 RepID=A0A4Q4STP7_9PEZI|nr:hypothetical protein DL764_010525 [Monosporascus ibericus]